VSAGPRELLQRHGLRLSRELGQNFLVDESIAERLATLSGVEPGDVVIEVGTGLGVLTRALARRAARVVSIEIDSGLVRALEAEQLLPENVELIHADALDQDLRALVERFDSPVRLVANLPYSAATPLLRRLLDLRDILQDWSVMVQRELAERLIAGRGSKDYGSFAVLHALTVDVQKQMELGPGSFFPAPQVHSAFVRIWPRPTQLLEPGELPAVERVVRQAFSQRRKTIFNCLRAGGYAPGGDRSRIDAALAEAGIEPGARAETIRPEALLALARALCAGANAAGPSDPPA
jgi:16S rRNA (adenine1518-N6/adenine1519-N6)-dimethyltransferase